MEIMNGSNKNKKSWNRDQNFIWKNRFHNNVDAKKQKYANKCSSVLTTQQNRLLSASECSSFNSQVK